MPSIVVFRVLSGGSLDAGAFPLPAETQAPSLNRQRLTWAHTDERAQSALEAATHAPAFIEQAPSSLQRADFWQSAAPPATHTPPFSAHLPSFSHAFEPLQASAFATHRPSAAVH